MAAPPRLYFHPISHYCVSAERMLAMKGIAPEIVRVPYHDKRQLLRETGQDYIPALRWDDDVVRWEEIPDFLDRKVPEHPLSPAGQRGVARTVEHWAHQVLEERVWRAVVTEVPPTLGDDLERWVFEEMQTRSRGPWHVLEMRKPEFTADLMAHVARVEEMLDGRSWLLGEPCRADCAVYGALSPWFTTGHALPGEYPRTRDWADRIRRL